MALHTFWERNYVSGKTAPEERISIGGDDEFTYLRIADEPSEYSSSVTLTRKRARKIALALLRWADDPRSKGASSRIR